MLLPPHLTIFLATGGGSARKTNQNSSLLTSTENYKPMWATIKPPSDEEIKEMEQKVEALNAKNDGWTYHLNMDSARNFIGFGLRNKPKGWFDKLIDKFK